MRHSIKVLLLALTLIVSSCNTSKKAAEAEAAKKAAAAKAAASKPKPKKGDIQPYSKVVTKDAKTDEGLFKVHNIDGKYLYEIPDSLLGREMLVVSRIAKNTSNNRNFGGQKANTQVLRWQKKDKKGHLHINFPGIQRLRMLLKPVASLIRR